MGQAFRKLRVTVSSHLPPPPDSGTRLDSARVRKLLLETLRLPRSKCFVGDRNYLAYPREQLEAFLAAQDLDKVKWVAEIHDCDDFARVLCGAERQWFRQHKLGQYGSTLGTIWGDIRRSETDTEPRPHAVNVFIDADLELWLVEPQTDVLSKPTSNSEFWFVCV